MKPQDSLIALKYKALLSPNLLSGVVPSSASSISYRELSSLIGVSVGEISKAIKRLEASKLLILTNGGVMVNKNNLAEWIIHGAKYIFPEVKAGFGRGMPTAWNCKFISSDIVPPQPGLAWKSGFPDQDDIQAELIMPVHSSVPLAASRDPIVHKAFSLLDILRTGSPRESNVAKDLLSQLIMES
jgi:hypothetical protein